MKKLLLTLGLISITVFAHAQGTIAFGNSALTRIVVPSGDGSSRNATAADGLIIGVFYGPAGTTDLVMAPGTATIGSTAGVMVGAPSVFALPGTEAGQVISLQIRAWNNQGWFGQTKVAQVTLGPTAGPGTVIWQSASGTNPNRFTPLIFVVPEPSTLALGALAGAFLLFRLRKTAWPN